jgi:hypothetical protein
MPGPNAKGRISYHILPAASTLLGVSLTALVLFQNVKTGKPSPIDELIAVSGAIFSVSAILSYLSIRKESQRYETAADVFFFIGLGLINIISLIFVVLF